MAMINSPGTLARMEDPAGAPPPAEQDISIEEMRRRAGLRMLEYNILVKPEEVSDVFQFDSGATLLKADQTIDDERAASTTGIVLDVSDTAFTFEDGAMVVEPGDRVVFARYAGMKVKGKDGEEYLILKDKSVAGVYLQED